MENQEQLTRLLTKVGKICDTAKKERAEKQKSGELYNVFSALKVEKTEMRHSAFIANLLDARADHGMGDEFLKAFLRNLELDENYIDASKPGFNVQMEYSIKNDDGKLTGKLDILVEDGARALIIENKIYADDQPLQLSKYNNFGKDNYPQGFQLIYLTRYGYKARNKSIWEEDIDYKPLSYKDDITAWLEECSGKASGHPLVRDAINQYIQIINRLTGRTMDKDYLEKVAKIATSKENRDSTLAIFEAQHQIAEMLIRECIVKPLKEFAKKKGYEFVDASDHITPSLKIYPTGWGNGYYICIISRGIKNQDDGNPDAYREPKVKWGGMFIGITHNLEGEELDKVRLKKKGELKFLDGEANKIWPYGSTQVEPNNWEKPSSFELMRTSKVFDWLKKKIEEIVKEVEKKGITV